MAQTTQSTPEISIFDIWDALIRYKAMLIGAVALGALMAVLYLFVTPPVYEAQVRLVVPKASAAMLDVPDPSYGQLDPKSVFGAYQAQLKRSESWRSFVTANPSLFSEGNGRAAALGFIPEAPIKLISDNDLAAESADAVFQHSDRQLAAEILRQYLTFVGRRYLDDLVMSVQFKIEQQKKAIAARIASLRESAKLVRDDEIERLLSEVAALVERGRLGRLDEIETLRAEVDVLKEQARMLRHDEIQRLKTDLALAHTLGVTENKLLHSADNVRVGGDIAVVPTRDAVRNYMRGTKALEGELEAISKRDSDEPYTAGLREKQARLESLMKRESDDPYIPGLRQKQAQLSQLLKRESDDPYISELRALQVELARLSQLTVAPGAFKPYEQDGDVFEPRYPIKPRKSVVLALGTLGGCVLGLLAVFVLAGVASMRNHRVSDGRT